MAGPVMRGQIVLVLGLAMLGGATRGAGDAVDDIIRTDVAARKNPGLSRAILEPGKLAKVAGRRE